ncbi:hypothetical protein AGOR_G00048940 [Albula goreensis]|uniref:PDZ domain-containing protein n=1 Tax=Albula goreensis TaxID=1534307 RepID=A0A8T3E0C6_9TELE|nr:hypothetical protein AGOR_G00048940 [Albula goreensis]
MMSIECPNPLPRPKGEEPPVTSPTAPPTTQIGARPTTRSPHHCKKVEPSELAGVCTIEKVLLKRGKDESFGLDLEIKSSPLKVLVTGLRPGGAAARESSGRMCIGDEIVAIGETPVCTSSYQEICDLMHNLSETLTLEIKKPVSAVDRLSSLMMSSGNEGNSRMDSFKNTPEENCEGLERRVGANQGSASSETNSKHAVQTDPKHEMPVTDIDDIISELSSSSDKDLKSEHTNSASNVHSNGTATSTAYNVLDPQQSKNLSAPPPLVRPTVLDFSVLDPGNKGRRLPVGKSFLQSYSRNFGNMSEEAASITNGPIDKKDSGISKCMYSMVDDSDSESDSTSEKVNHMVSLQSSVLQTSADPPLPPEPQETDSEEEVEICYSETLNSRPQPENHTAKEGSGMLSPPHEAMGSLREKKEQSLDLCQGEPSISLAKTPADNAGSSCQTIEELTVNHRGSPEPQHSLCIKKDSHDVINLSDPTSEAPLSPGPQSTVTLLTSEKSNSTSGEKMGCQSSSCAKSINSIKTSDPQVATKSDDVVVAATTGCQSLMSQGDSYLMQGKCHVNPRTPERTAKLRAKAALPSEKPPDLLITSTLFATESKSSLQSNEESCRRASTAVEQKEEQKEKAPSPPESRMAAPSEAHSNSPSHSQEEIKSEKDCSGSSQSSSTLKPNDRSIKPNSGPKLKGLTLKSVCKMQDQPITKQSRPESPIQRKPLASPIQSPKIQAKRVPLTSSFQSAKLVDKNTPVSPRLINHRLSKVIDDPSTSMAEPPTFCLEFSGLFSDKRREPIADKAKAEDSSAQAESGLPSKEKPAVTTQRTFIEVRLSSSSLPSSSASTPVLGRKEIHENSSSSPHSPGLTSPSFSKCTMRSTDSSGSGPGALQSQAGPSNPLNNKEVFNAVPSDDSSEPAADKHSLIMNNVEKDDNLKNYGVMATSNFIEASREKLRLLKLDRRSYSTETSANPFSVRQRIKSFENLANCDRPIIRCIDIQSYGGVTSKPPLSRRSSGYVSSVTSPSADYRSLRRSLSSCADNLNDIPPLSPQLGRPPPSTALMTFDPSPSCGGLDSHLEEETVPTLSEPEGACPPQTPPLVRTRNSRGRSGLSRSRLRELRALSMPDLDKLCTEDFASMAAGADIFKTELEVQPRRSAGNPPGSPPCPSSTPPGPADFTRDSRSGQSNGRVGAMGSVSGQDFPYSKTNEQQSSDCSWSISLSELEVSPTEQSKLQSVLSSLTDIADVSTLVQEVKAVAEVKEDIHFVVLTKEEGSGLGFSIAGGVDLEQKSITVHRVFSRGVAGVEGTIQRGDNIISINGTSLGGTTHGEALSSLHRARLPTHALVVIRRGKESEPLSPKQDSSTRTGGQPATSRDISVGTGTVIEVGPDGALSVELQKTSAGLGFSLDGGKASAQGDKPLNIKRIFKGGAAELSRVIDIGDEVLAINGRSLQGLMHYDAWNIIKAVSEGPVQLVIRKPRTSV